MALATIRDPGRTDGRRCDRETRVTRSLLGYGALAGPFYVVVALAQALLRPGFDVAHDDVSLLANGALGWVQVLNFVATGAMVIAFSIGLHRAMNVGRGSTWAPRLVAGYGIGLILAGIFTADPMNGFPAGTPAGPPASITLHGLLHILTAAAGFVCFVTACFSIAGRFSSRGERPWQAFSIVTGVAFLAGFIGVATGSTNSAVVIAFWAGLIVGWSWMAALAVRTYTRLGPGEVAV